MLFFFAFFLPWELSFSKILKIEGTMGLDKSVPIDYLHLTLVDGSSVTAMHVRLCVCVRGWVCV